MKKLIFLKIFLCVAFMGLLTPSVEAGFPYSMTYTVSAGDTILADHYNTANNEHINNNIPESIDDYSATVAEMGGTKDPYAGDTEVQALTLAEEIQELRFKLDVITKKFNTSATKWYHDTTDEGVLWVTAADVASAAALPLINDGLRIDVTGTETVTSMDTVGVGTVKCLQFDAALTLTHHATDLILPGATNITTFAGFRAWFHEYATGDWELIGQARGFLDDDSMATATDSTVASSESIKAYVDTVSHIVLGTEQASTSGTAIDFTGIPAGTKKITIMLVGVSTDGTEELLVQLGDSGGVETSGYLGAVSSQGNTARSTAGLQVTIVSTADAVAHGNIILTLENSANFTWTSCSGVSLSNTDAAFSGSGSKSLSAELDRVTITSTGTPDDFDAGVINIQYE